ncbi:hypothetical protein CLOM_g13821 [Closterium sp. NIES-68]|nr:hypothetical protein CLOM_g13821 [Closterium sp. NIES-68]
MAEGQSERERRMHQRVATLLKLKHENIVPCVGAIRTTAPSPPTNAATSNSMRGGSSHASGINSNTTTTTTSSGIHLLFAAFDFVPVPSLAHQLTDCGPMPEETLSFCLRQVVEALAAFHALGIPHGNVRTTSVFVPDDGVVKLAGTSFLDGEAREGWRGEERGGRQGVAAVGLVMRERGGGEAKCRGALLRRSERRQWERQQTYGRWAVWQCTWRREPCHGRMWGMEIRCSSSSLTAGFSRTFPRTPPPHSSILSQPVWTVNHLAAQLQSGSSSTFF